MATPADWRCQGPNAKLLSINTNSRGGIRPYLWSEFEENASVGSKRYVDACRGVVVDLRPELAGTISLCRKVIEVETTTDLLLRVVEIEQCKIADITFAH